MEYCLWLFIDSFIQFCRNHWIIILGLFALVLLSILVSILDNPNPNAKNKKQKVTIAGNVDSVDYQVNNGVAQVLVKFEDGRNYIWDNWPTEGVPDSQYVYFDIEITEDSEGKHYRVISVYE